MKKILLAFGTRPEIIKLGPVYRELNRRGDARVDVFWSGQHVELAEGLLELFDIKVSYFGDVLTGRCGLAEKVGRTIETLGGLVEQTRYDWIVVQGDTATAAAVAMAGFLHNTPVAHVEAGLRTWDLHSPWPEEFNRRAISLCATLHFAPTPAARRNLIREGFPEEQVLVTGNTVVDALTFVRAALGPEYSPKSEQLRRLALDKKLILVTGHRRENFGEPLRNVLRALKTLAADGDKSIVFPVHLNPNVREVAFAELGDAPDIHLIEPLQYPDFVHLLDRAWLVVTDSGGIQEEAPTFGKPVIITRESTERPEVVQAGFGRLVGTDAARIVRAVRKFTAGAKPIVIRGENPFGQGDAAERIAAALHHHPGSQAASKGSAGRKRAATFPNGLRSTFGAAGFWIAPFLPLK